MGGDTVTIFHDNKLRKIFVIENETVFFRIFANYNQLNVIKDCTKIIYHKLKYFVLCEVSKKYYNVSINVTVTIFSIYSTVSTTNSLFN